MIQMWEQFEMQDDTDGKFKVRIPPVSECILPGHEKRKMLIAAAGVLTFTATTERRW